jgi:hypothetical protein
MALRKGVKKREKKRRVEGQGMGADLPVLREQGYLLQAKKQDLCL